MHEHCAYDKSIWGNVPAVVMSYLEELEKHLEKEKKKQKKYVLKKFEAEKNS